MSIPFAALLLLLAAAMTLAAEDCFVPGSCIGELLGFEVSTDGDALACLDACKHEPDCNWFTASEKDDFGGFYLTCDDIDVESCPSCVSGTLFLCNFLLNVPIPPTLFYVSLYFCCAF
jgi:hypothetical protein